MLRSLLFYTVLFFGTILLGFTAAVAALLTRSGNVSHLIGRLWARLMLFASGVKVQVSGLQNVALNEAYVFAANHQSQFDIFALLGHLPIQFRWLAKAELFRLPFLGAGMRGAGYIPIDRSDRKAAFQSIELAAARVRGGISIVIFPEGTRSLDGKLKDFKKGGFHLAIKSRRPMVPLTISGTFSILPKEGFRVRPRLVRIYVGEPVPTENVTSKDRDWLISEVRRRIQEHLPDAEKGEPEPMVARSSPVDTRLS